LAKYQRLKPYTTIGIKCKKCFRCGGQAIFQWQICSDGNQYRPICLECDIELNGMVLQWLGSAMAWFCRLGEKDRRI